MGSSYQKGWVRLRGKKWYGYFRRTELDPATDQPKPAVAQVILGLKTEMSKSQAREKLESEIARLGKQPNGDKSMINGAVTFGWFVNHRYLPLKEADWREETAKVKKHIIKADLIDEFHDVRLENIDKFTLQTHLNKLAKSRSKDRVLQIRSYMKAIFAEAVDQEFLSKDPAHSVKTPSNLRESDKTTLTWNQLRAALAKLGLRDRILLELDMTNALRPSELFGLKWKCFPRRLRRSPLWRPPTRGRFAPLGRRVEASPQFRSPRSWRRNSCNGESEARIHLLRPSSFRAASGDSWIRATSVIVSCTSWPRSWNCRS